MNETDLRDCFAMFAMTGWLMNGDYTKEEIPRLSYDMADAMLEARKAEPDDEEGIVSIKKRVRKTK
jgi:hypothetical protein